MALTFLLQAVSAAGRQRLVAETVQAKNTDGLAHSVGLRVGGYQV
jgi:hypothetical protein